MSTKQVIVLDYGSGNIRSAVRALEHVGAHVTLSADPELVSQADGLVVPGVGAFASCMSGLRAVGGHDMISHRLADERPVLGVCVGMQILFEHGVEGTPVEGLGHWRGTVERLHSQRLPHMGWNTVEVPEGSALLEGLSGDRFYFVHSYAVRAWDNSEHRSPHVTWAEHDGDRFIAAVEDGPLQATQFHPEKSGEAGLQLLENWVRSLSA